jgi:hypothetical protein
MDSSRRRRRAVAAAEDEEDHVNVDLPRGIGPGHARGLCCPGLNPVATETTGPSTSSAPAAMEPPGSDTQVRSRPSLD